MALTRRSRANERGAALFIVVLIVVLLTAIGVFAAHVTSMAQVASGYSRRAGSAFYLGEYMLSSEMPYVAMDVKDNGVQGSDCRDNRGLAALRPPNTLLTCVQRHTTDFVAGGRWPTAITADSEGVYGALSRDQSIDAALDLEISDVVVTGQGQAGQAMAGSPVVSQTKFTTVRVSGGVRPALSGLDKCDPAITRASNEVSMRAFIIYSGN